MDRATKDMAVALHSALSVLSRTYKNVEVVYIRHHTRAKEADEHGSLFARDRGDDCLQRA